jgi:hypothetical protein
MRTTSAATGVAERAAMMSQRPERFLLATRPPFRKVPSSLLGEGGVL